MNFRPFLSERTVELLDACMKDLDLWDFDAINAPLLLNQLYLDESTRLMDYILSDYESIEDDGDRLLPFRL